MDILGLNMLTTQVLWAAFILSMLFGAIAQRTHFCTMGAVSDIVNMGDWTRMRMWGMAIGVAMIGFFGMAAAGLIDPDKTVYASSRFIWLSALVASEPDHLRAPEALLSMANCQDELKDVKTGRQTLGNLVKAYPQSEAATVAKDRLTKLK
jgi:hypothetical protein